MPRLMNRVADLERREASASSWARVFRYVGQSVAEAVAAWEAEHGSIDQCAMRVIIQKPLTREGQPTGALCRT